MENEDGSIFLLVRVFQVKPVIIIIMELFWFVRKKLTFNFTYLRVGCWLFVEFV